MEVEGEKPELSGRIDTRVFLVRRRRTGGEMTRYGVESGFERWKIYRMGEEEGDRVEESGEGEKSTYFGGY